MIEGEEDEKKYDKQNYTTQKLRRSSHREQRIQHQLQGLDVLVYWRKVILPVG